MTDPVCLRPITARGTIGNVTATGWLALVGPVLAFGGVVAGLWLGQRRWKHEQEKAEREAYNKALREAYMELWDVVEDAHLKMRQAVTGLGTGTFPGFLTDVNSFMIRRGLYIAPEDRNLVQEYLFWTNEYLRKCAGSEELRDRIATTGSSPGLSSGVYVLIQLDLRTESLREQLKQRIREVCGVSNAANRPLDSRLSTDLVDKYQALIKEADQNAPVPIYELSPEMLRSLTRPGGPGEIGDTG
jgi:hypothetical protein